MQQLDASLGRAVEQWNNANYKLTRVQHDLTTNGFELKVAKQNLGQSRQRIARRLVVLYTSEQASTLEVILGAKSLDDMINRIEGANRVSSLDAQVLKQVETFGKAVKLHRAALKSARAEAQRLVSERAAQKRSIESQLAQRHQMLASLHGEIARLVAQQNARSLQMANEAKARLAAQQADAHAASTDTIVGAAAATPEGVTVAPPSTHGGVVGVAMSFLGTPYAWGGGAPGGFDCSGLVMYSYAQVGVSLPHSSYAQYGAGVPVSKDQLQPGDLVFFDGLGHVGIYIGGGQFVHAPHTGDVVKVSSLGESWYAATYVGARRIL